MVDTPRGEAEFYEGGDMDELSKQLEKERYMCIKKFIDGQQYPVAGTMCGCIMLLR